MFGGIPAVDDGLEQLGNSGRLEDGPAIFAGGDDRGSNVIYPQIADESYAGIVNARAVFFKFLMEQPIFAVAETVDG